ncbi:Zinc finger, RING/FYVE/PHD-type [Parasponia andersonii]|uniref:RING-type E3 ubiquitin transferase n=1 Tax=Parasponia andersonii TaxID=3476 RepID=A0A2P5B2F7_PARAD|nr:Zinc finger, RING/FYVE/PHD-type [Parasponia andersonii]
MEDAALPPPPPPPGMLAKLSQHGSGPGPSPRSTSSELMANVGGGGRVDEEECRICRGPGEAGNPLRYPCACRGTIKYVHQDCLLRWLNRRKISRCEA